MYRPRCEFFVNGSPIAPTYITSSFVGSTIILCIVFVFSSPIGIQLFPASSDLNIPIPKFIEFRGLPSPVPTQITLEFDCEIAKEPMFCVGCSSNIGAQLEPPFSDFQTPPEAAPTYIIFGFSFTASMVVILPLMFAGPIFLMLRFFILSVSSFCA